MSIHPCKRGERESKSGSGGGGPSLSISERDSASIYFSTEPSMKDVHTEEGRRLVLRDRVFLVGKGNVEATNNFAVVLCGWIPFPAESD